MVAHLEQNKKNGFKESDETTSEYFKEENPREIRQTDQSASWNVFFNRTSMFWMAPTDPNSNFTEESKKKKHRDFEQVI
jgi:hypothetical protein